MGIKLVVTDLDDTLLRRDKTISTYTADVFRRLRERGILTAFATARDFRSVTEQISPLYGVTPDVIIADNGALARVKGADLYKRLIPAETANALRPRLCPVRCVSTEKHYYLYRDCKSEPWRMGKTDTVVTDFTSPLEEDVLFLDGGGGGKPESIGAGFPDVRVVTYTGTGLVTIVHREATKLRALVAVREALGVKAADVAAFGDDHGDMEMLRACGTGVAVANAVSGLKAVANAICGDCDDDGVARWLAEYVL